MTSSSSTQGNTTTHGDYNFGIGGEISDAFALKLTFANDEARETWARGYCFMLNYNHEEAMACFQETLEKHDPNCVMAWWGISYAVSPTYNFPPGLGSGYDAIQKALGLLDDNQVSDLEVDLIKALSKRHSAEARDSADPSTMNMGNDPALGPPYVEAMEAIYNKYSDSQDVVALYVEARMNLNPWGLWVKKNEDENCIVPADENTLIIEKVLKETIDYHGYTHPAICHLQCHALELSPYPERALPAADALRTMMPDAGHLVHMASHIDAWVGQWKEAIDCNLKGVVADDKYVETSGKDSMLYKFYRMHNHHFVVWCSMFDGQYGQAMEIARKIERQLPAGENGVEFVLGGVVPMGAVFLEAWLSMPWHVMIRFGKWNEILAEPQRTDKNVYAGTIATQHYARGVAFASLGRVEEAEIERVKFYEALENPALAGRVLHNNAMYQDPKDGPSILAVSAQVLEGEIEYRKQFLLKKSNKPYNFEKAFDHIRNAVHLDLNLKYDEPWGQMQPTRHILGALTLEQGFIDEAEEAYRADIKMWKDNMWGLLGLKLCLEARLEKSILEGGMSNEQRSKIEEELEQVTALFKKRSERADIIPAKTCFCAQNALASTSTTNKTSCGKKTTASSCCGSKKNKIEQETKTSSRRV